MDPSPPNPGVNQSQAARDSTSQSSDEGDTHAILTSGNSPSPLSLVTGGSELWRTNGTHHSRMLQSQGYLQQPVRPLTAGSGQPVSQSSVADVGLSHFESDRSLGPSQANRSLRQPANPLPSRLRAGQPHASSDLTTGSADPLPLPGAVPRPAIAGQRWRVQQPSSNPLPNARQNDAYSAMGVITSRPHRSDNAIPAIRQATFHNWPEDHPVRKEDLCEAGFFYTGNTDCVRCFHCGVGIKNWRHWDNAWIEHARHRPNCGYMRMRMGKDFIKTVTDLHRRGAELTMQSVAERMGVDPADISQTGTCLRKDPAVVAVQEMGYQIEDILPIADSLKQDGRLDAYNLFTALQERRGEESKEELKNVMISTKNHLERGLLCMVCRVEKRSAVLLPCGHLVCCCPCASVLEKCPVCQNVIDGLVRAFLS